MSIIEGPLIRLILTVAHLKVETFASWKLVGPQVYSSSCGRKIRGICEP